MIVKVTQPTILEKRPLVLFASIVLSLEIFRIMNRIGTGTMPLMTAAYIRAWIGSIFSRYRHPIFFLNTGEFVQKITAVSHILWDEVIYILDEVI